MKQSSLINLLARLFVASLLIFSVSACSSSSSARGNISDPDGMALDEMDLDARREARFGIGNIPVGESEGIFRDVRFGYDSDEIDDVARQNIEYNVQILEENPSVGIQLEGHCDERGTAEYNLALGERRARSVMSLLLSYGIKKERLQTISYGEEVPIDNASNETAWSKNRRVHFSAYNQGN